jgi:hypothetical protein
MQPDLGAVTARLRNSEIECRVHVDPSGCGLEQARNTGRWIECWESCADLESRQPFNLQGVSSRAFADTAE